MTEVLTSACRRLQRHDETLTLLNLSCMGVGSEGVVKLSKSCCYSSLLVGDHNSNSDFMPRTKEPAQFEEQQQCDEDGGADQQTHHMQKVAVTTTTTPLVALWLEGNEIYASGAKALRTVLPVSPRLKYLYLSNNHIGNAGTAALIPIAFQQLEVCNLSDNDVGFDGALVIADSLMTMNKIGNDGDDDRNQDAKSSATGISVVKSLILDNNRLGEEGAKAIATSLRHNKTLNHLDLRYNRIGVDGMRAFRDVLKDKGNTTLKYLLLEEETGDLRHDEAEDDDEVVDGVVCTRQLPRRRNRKVPRVMEKRTCPCNVCGIRYEIEYYLALNRAGRHSFHNTRIGANLWPLLLANKTEDEASLIYTILVERPDISLVR
jgi:hypothetical protein